MTPQFLIVGVAEGDVVALLASKELTLAELKHEAEELHSMRMFTPSRPRVTLTTRIGTYRIVRGASYEEAFRMLFECWSPAPEPAPGVEASPRVIER